MANYLFKKNMTYVRGITPYLRTRFRLKFVFLCKKPCNSSILNHQTWSYFPKSSKKWTLKIKKLISFFWGYLTTADFVQRPFCSTADFEQRPEVQKPHDNSPMVLRPPAGQRPRCTSESAVVQKGRCKIPPKIEKIIAKKRSIFLRVLYIEKNRQIKNFSKCDFKWISVNN